MNTMSLYRPRGGLSILLAMFFTIFTITAHAAPPPVPDDTGPTTDAVITTAPATGTIAFTGDPTAIPTATMGTKTGPQASAGMNIETTTTTTTTSGTGTWVPADLKILLRGHQAPDYPTAIAATTSTPGKSPSRNTAWACREGPSNQLVPS